MDQTLFSGNEATHTGGGASFMESVARAPVAVQVSYTPDCFLATKITTA